MKTSMTSAMAILFLAAAPAYAGQLMQEPPAEPDVDMSAGMGMSNDDMVDQMTTYTPTDHWTGPWVGLNFGAGSMSPRATVGRMSNPDAFSLSINGPVGGIEAGYAVQMDNFVVGAAIDYTHLDLSDEIPVGRGRSFGVHADDTITLSGRAGYLVSESVQFYGTAGVTRGRFNFDYDTGDDVGSYDDNLLGGTLGVGMETMVTESLSLSAEYRYTRFEDVEFENSSHDVAGEAEPSLHDARVGVNMRF